MSRVNEAMRRAGQNDDEIEDTATAAAENAQFVAGEDSHDNPEPEIEQTVNPGRLVRRVPALPVEMIRSDSSEDIQVLDVMRLLLRRWKLIAGVVAASLSLAAAYNYSATPLYEARARLIIESDPAQVVPFQTGEGGGNPGRFDYYSTQLEILRSRALARKTLERLQLKELPGGLTVAPSKADQSETRVVNITFTSTNPELAARIANELAKTYVDQNLEVRRQGSRDASKWLNERLAELRQQVTSSAGALQQYRAQKDAVSLDDRQNIVLQKLTQLSAAVTSARTETVQQETLYQQLNEIQKSGAPLDTFPPILSNTYIQGLKAELGGLQRERGQLAERLGELHPDMIKVDTAIAATELRLKAEMDKVVEGVRNNFKEAQARERGLSSELEAQKRQVLDLNQKSIGYGALQRDANSTQQIFDSVLQRLKETQISGELQTNNARILDDALVPRVSVWPRTQLNLAVALFIGGFLGVGLVIGMEYLNPRITKPEDVSEAFGLPLLGIAPLIKGQNKGPLRVDNLPPAFQEALRGIRTRIMLSPIAAAARTLAVTSTSPGEGKTAVASSLAVSLATAGRRVLLVDADLRRPQLHRVFDVPASPGLSNIMAGEVKPSATLLKSVVTGLFILPAGADVPNASDLLDSERLHDLINGFSQVFDIVVMDCPPVMALADASIMANAASSVLFVVGAGATSREAAQVAIDRLMAVQAQVIGVVLNKAKPDHLSAYHYPYYQVGDVA